MQEFKHRRIVNKAIKTSQGKDKENWIVETEYIIFHNNGWPIYNGIIFDTHLNIQF